MELLFVLTLVLSLPVVHGKCSRKAINRDSYLQDVYVDYPPLQTLTAIFSPVTCGKRCLDHPGCSTYFHNPNNATCRLHNVTFVTSPLYVGSSQRIVDPGSKYYKLVEPSGICGDFIWERELNKCYFFYKDLTDFVGAKQKCSQKGGRMIQIETQEFYDKFVAQILSNSEINRGGYLLGGTDQEKEGVWQWTDGSTIQGFYWADGYPKGQAETQDYLMTTRGSGWRWQDTRIDVSQRAYVCERLL